MSFGFGFANIADRHGPLWERRDTPRIRGRNKISENA
jgi:hypothetical protein